MIDIFGTIEQSHNFLELFKQTIQEFSRFFSRFAILLGILYLVKRFLAKKAVWAILLLPILQMCYVWSVSTRTEFLYAVCFAFLLTLQLWLLRLLPLRREDYIFFFSALLFPNRLFNSTSTILGDLWMFWVVFFVLYAMVWVSLRSLRGNQFYCYFLFVILSLSAYVFRLSTFFLYPMALDWGGSHVLGMIGTIVVMLILLPVAASVIYAKFQKPLAKLNQLGQKYKDIETYFLSFSIFSLILCTVLFLPFAMLNAINALVVVLFPTLCLSLLWVQLPFIRLLFRVAFYKDSVAFSQWEKEGLSSFYQSLTTSLTAMQEMSHDVKNIFFTMGNFVDRSEDLEMKAFFWEKIYPYSIGTIQQSELLSKLYQIPQESLLAFFYLKISQALSQEILVELEVNMIPEQFQVGMEVLDLTRVLGILLDNAIEETEKIPNGSITIKITGNNTGCSYIIKNTITEQSQKQGIRVGISNKGVGRGKGLQIVQQILGQYDIATLNASIQQETYIQSLNVFTNDIL